MTQDTRAELLARIDETNTLMACQVRSDVERFFGDAAGPLPGTPAQVPARESLKITFLEADPAEVQILAAQREVYRRQPPRDIPLLFENDSFGG